MSTPLFVRLGPGPTLKKYAYAGIVDFNVTYRIGGNDDDEAIAAALHHFKGNLVCEPELAEAASRAGVPTRKLGPVDLFVKARQAAPILAPGAYKNCPEDEAIEDLWSVARNYALTLAAGPDDEVRFAAKVRGTFDDTSIERDLLLVSSRPSGLRIHDRDVADQSDYVYLDFTEESVELREMTTESIGLDRVPRIRAMSNGVGALVDDATYALVCACADAIVRHQETNTRSFVYKPRLGGVLMVELT